MIILKTLFNNNKNIYYNYISYIIIIPIYELLKTFKYLFLQI